MNKKFWTIDKNGEHVLRDLSKEEEGWSYLGFKSFVLFHGGGNLRTVSFWKE